MKTIRKSRFRQECWSVFSVCGMGGGRGSLVIVALLGIKRDFSISGFSAVG